MINKEDLEIIRLTDDLDYIVQEIKRSVYQQMEVLKDIGLGTTNYYKSLSSFKKKTKKKKWKKKYW